MYKITGATGIAASWVENKIGSHDGFNSNGHKSWSVVSNKFVEEECFKLPRDAHKSYFKKNELRFELEKNSSIYVAKI